MTPERKEYLENIPLKEKITREIIKITKIQRAEYQRDIENCRYGRFHYRGLTDEERFLKLRELKTGKMLVKKPSVHLQELCLKNV